MDPEHRIYFRKVLGRDDFIRLEPLDVEDFKDESSMGYNETKRLML